VVAPYVFADDAERVRACVVAAYERQNAEGCVKVWEDLDRYRAVIKRARPDLIIECGTHTGASAAWFAKRVGKVLTIDVNPQTPSVYLHPNVSHLVGSSTSGHILSLVRRFVRRYDRVMVVLDSDHSAAHVTAEIDAYGPLVSVGQYLVVEDAIARWMPAETAHGTPYDAIESRLYDNPEWTQDTSTRDRHTITMFPEGWWVRNAR
jgi:cephalosporin hydroxylase